MSPKLRWGLWIVWGLLLIAVALFWFASRGFTNYQTFGTRLVPPRPAYDFTLIDPQNKPLKLSDFRGKVVLIFFGYVGCPDVCPLTMLELSKIYKALTPQEQARIQVLMITTDPKRDTPERVGRYARAFHPSFIGLAGSAEAIAKTAQQYGAGYFVEKAESPERYFVAHTAAVFLVNPIGQYELVYSKGKTAQTKRMVRDVRWALRKI